MPVASGGGGDGDADDDELGANDVAVGRLHDTVFPPLRKHHVKKLRLRRPNFAR